MALTRPATLVILAVFLIGIPQTCHSAKFIMFCTAGSQSHLNPFYAIGNALVEKGHEVTIVSSLPPKNHSKIIEIFLEQNHKIVFGNSSAMGALVTTALNTSGGTYKVWIDMLTKFPLSCNGILDDPAFQKIIKAGRKYDVALNNYFFNDCTLPIASKVAKYVVFAGATGLMNHIAYDLNVPYPTSYIPNIALEIIPTTFLQRAASAIFGWVWLICHQVYTVPTIEGIIQERYPGLPSINEVKKNISFVLLSHNSATDGAHPSVPYIQEIGGIHLRPAKPIPKEFDTFIKKGGNAGFIFVSLGSVVPEELIPEEKNKIFVEAFSKLPFQVIWKFKQQRSDLPPNVMTTKWAPQMDILGDKRCLAFITHGGHASVDEALYNGVPTVGMPVFGDQPLNVVKGVAKGYMEDLLWSELNLERMLQKVNKIIKNPKYKEAAVKQSKLLKDQIQSPLDRAVFWLEYVIRHDGARHLRTAADHLNFFQYFLLDVMAAAALVLTLVLYVIYKLIRLVVRVTCCRGSKSSQQVKKKVKKN